MKTIGRQFLPPHFPPTSICAHMLVFCARVGKTDLCSGLSILILSELGSVPSYLRDTTSATLPLSLLHHPFLSLSDNSISTQTWRNFSHLKTKTRNAVPPRLFCQLCLYFNNKITLKNCLYICRLQALLFLLNSLHDAKSNGCFFVVCHSWQPITSSFLKHFLRLAPRILHQLSAFLSATHLVSYWFLLISSKLWSDQSLKLTKGFIYAHSLGNLTSALGFKYYDMLTPP